MGQLCRLTNVAHNAITSERASPSVKENTSSSEAAFQPVRASIARKLLYTFLLLVAVIIFNSLYSAIKEYRSLSARVHNSMNTKLETVSAILLSEQEKFSMIAGIVREKRNKVLQFLDYENYRSIQIMLQMVASKHNLDRIFFLDEYKELLLTDEKLLPEVTNPLLFQVLADDKLLDKTALATIPVSFFENEPGLNGPMDSSGDSYLCLQAVVPIYHDLGDIYGYIVLVKAIDDDRRLADYITKMTDTRFVIYNNLSAAGAKDVHRAILSNFSDTQTIPFPVDGKVTFNGSSYLSQTKAISDISGRTIGHISVLKNRIILQVERKRQLVNSLPPFIAAILISILLFFMLQRLIIHRVYLLINILQSLSGKKRTLDERLPVHKDQTKFDEIDLMYMHFNNMMDQLQTTYNQLEIARREAESANIAKGDFLANMSHEIRTPMNAIIGLTDLMISQEIPAKVRDNLQIIKTSSEGLLGIINDILDFSKIEAGMLHMEQVEFRLQEVLDPLVDLFGETCDQKQLELFIRVDADVPAFLVGDPLRLRQVLINLVANAVKFTDRGDIVVDVRCKGKDRLAGNLLFSVQDSGVGIEPEQIETLFTAFTQADGSHTRRYGGTGLGLAICRQLVKMMGGSIAASSLPGTGSTFTFTATFAVPDAVEESTRTHSTADLQGVPVLLVDDNPIARQIYSEVLSSSLELKVTTACSGKEGLAILHEAAADKPYQLVIIDRLLDGENGAATAEQLHHIPELVDLSILLMGSGMDETDLSPAQTAAIDGYIRKPVKNSLLVSTVRDLFLRTKGGRNKRLSARETGNAQYNGFKNLEILVVEDNVINQQVARKLLESAGIGVTVAEYGRQALDILTERPNVFDGILMDIQMPDMDGYEVTGIIRKQEQFKELPIIAMTAHVTKNDRQKSLSAGMDAHLTKPIRRVDLFSTLDTVLRTDAKKKSIDLAPLVATAPSQDAAPDFPKTMPGIDIQSGLQTLSGNSALYKSLLIDFFHDYAGVADRITVLLSQGNLEESAALIHTVKGVSGNLAAEDLYQAACALETAVKGEALDFSKQLDTFIDCHAELFQAISDTFMRDNGKKSPPTAAGGNIAAKAALLRLSELIRLNDADIEEYLDSIDLEADCPEIQSLLQVFRSQVGRFDFPGAGRTLAAIAEKLKITL